jgi:hypothetical protein
MAIMFPQKPKFFHEASLEGLVFEALEKLPDDYYVFHSFQLWESNERTKDVEIDFVIFNPKYGILTLEAKAGEVQVINGEWYYASGRLMANGGPFQQARQNKYAIKNLIDRKGDKFELIKKLPFLHAVCFPSLTKGALLSIELPPDCPNELVITKDDLEFIEPALIKIFSYQHLKMQKPLTLGEIKYLIYHILAPSFKLIPPPNLNYDLKSIKFNQMLQEQYVLMDFLENQKKATISGAAGTGKTMIAIEKARRHAESNQKVLFLCYNRNLRDYLSRYYNHDFIDFFTIDMYAFKIGYKATITPYQALKTYLENCYLDEEDFGYDHVIIDEGQDFGQESLNESEIISLLDLNVSKRNGTFYVFYDKLQLIQGQTFPEYIEKSDCKITLYKNCRNTINIANTSMKPLEIEPILFKGAIHGKTPEFHLETDHKDALNKLRDVIKKYREEGYKDIMVLSVKSSIKSHLNRFPENEDTEIDHVRFKWTTTRKFKGLEADVVILVDVDQETFEKDKLIFYVGSSRARFELSIISSMSLEDAKHLVERINPKMKKYHPKKGLAAIIGAISV